MCFVLLTLISCRIRVRLADCQTMLTWGVQIGHAGHLSSGCALVDENQLTDLSGKVTSPRDLENSRVVDTTATTSIPKLLHQSYKSFMVPNSVVPFVESWHVSLKDWTFLWWTDDDLEWLLHTHYTEYAKSYSRMPHTIMKVDTARYFILHHYGGVYADMDIEYTPKENVSLTQILTRVSPTNKTNLAIIFHDCTDNSLMASTPNASFWLHVFEKWNKATNSLKHKRTVHSVSGVSMLGNVCTEQDKDSHVIIMPFENSNFDVHHGTNSWRWKTKRDDLVLVLDVAIMLYVFVMMFVVAVSSREESSRDRQD